MKKNLITIITIFGIITLLYFCLLPNINYDKLGYVSFSSFSPQSINSKVSKEKVDKTIILQLCLDYSVYNSDKKLNYLNNDLYDYKKSQKEFRNGAKEYHKGNNNKIINGLYFGNYQEIYISSYSPFIDITYDYNYFMKHKDNILSNVTNIKDLKEINIIEDYNDQGVYEECIDYACRDSGALEVYQNRSKTGSGITVGVLEPGWIDDDHADLANTDIIFHSSVYSVLPSKDHTTQMALIIAGENGVAPGVTLLNSYLGGTMNNEVDWMLDNGVDIINMSFIEDGNLGTYSTVSAYADYIVYTYDVLIVAGAGNEGKDTGYIGNPGLGHNVITVGSMGVTHERSSFSSYIEGNGPLKPTICTFGESVYLLDEDNTEISGTSPATALCSGMLALILEDYPILTTKKGELMSLMCVNATYNVLADFSEDNGFDDEIGAGLFNYQNMIDNYGTSYSIVNTTYEAGDNVVFREVYIPANKTIRLACACIAKSTGSVGSIEFTDYDIFLLDKNNNILALGNSWNSTIDMLTYTTTNAGYYRIKVYQESDRVGSSDTVGMAYSIN